MPALTKSQIDAAADIHRERVTVPEWGGYVYICTMSGAQRDAWESSILTIRPDGSQQHNLLNIRAKMLHNCMVDDGNEPIYANPEELSKKSGQVLARLFAKAQEINAVTDADVEELAKN